MKENNKFLIRKNPESEEISENIFLIQIIIEINNPQHENIEVNLKNDNYETIIEKHTYGNNDSLIIRLKLNEINKFEIINNLSLLFTLKNNIEVVSIQSILYTPDKSKILKNHIKDIFSMMKRYIIYDDQINFEK